MLSLFFPGKRLMRQLRMPGKFGIIVIALLVPLAMLLHLYVAKVNDDIDFGRNEMRGSATLRLINPVMDAVLRQRGQAMLQLAGAPDPGERGAAEAAVNKQLASLEQALRADDPFGVLPLLPALAQAWKDAAAGPYTDTLQITAKYGAVSSALTALRRKVSESSALALDPDADSYYLMISGTDKLPLLSENLAPVRALATYVAAHPDQREASAMRIAGFMALLRSHADDVLDAYQRVDAATPGLLTAERSALAKVGAYLGKVNAQFSAGPDAPAIAAATLYAEGTALLDAVSVLNGATLDTLDRAISTRIGNLAARRNLMLGAVGFALLLAGYALMSFFLAAKSGFEGIALRVERLGQGDLSTIPSGAGKDEISNAIGMLGVSVTSLGAIVTGVRTSAESISLASSEIAAGNSDLAERGARIAGTVHEAAANMQSLAGQVARNLEHATAADELALSAFKLATRGEKTVSDAVAMMERITVSSRRIGDITQVIDSIAFQTNILALNAAVEAARAGEQGRGFAVVASEVRNLAQRCAAAAREIGALVQTSMGDVREGAQLVGSAGATMQDIVGAVQRVTVVMDQITRASNAQSDDINLMARSVDEVEASTQQNAAMVEEISAAVLSLQERADYLTDSVKLFRVNPQA